MTASHITIIQLADAVEEYVSAELQDGFMLTLKGISGNKSVKETVAALDDELTRRKEGR